MFNGNAISRNKKQTFTQSIKIKKTAEEIARELREKREREDEERRRKESESGGLVLNVDGHLGISLGDGLSLGLDGSGLHVGFGIKLG